MKLAVTLPRLVGLAAVATAPVVNAEIFLSPGSTWEYTFTDPTADPTWNTTTGGWSTGPAPFGNVFGGDFGYATGTFWGADASGLLADDLWVRTTVDLSAADLATIAYDLGVDNGYTLYVNGSLVSSANAEGYTFRWEYTGAIPEGILVPGINVVALALEDHGGLTAFDMQIRGDVAPVVPEASNVAVGAVLVGLAGYAMARRRSRGVSSREKE